MNIVKKDSFRSQGTLINQSDDMYRVVVDMTYHEFFEFKKWTCCEMVAKDEIRLITESIISCIKAGKYDNAKILAESIINVYV